MFWIILFKNRYKITKFMCKHCYDFVTFFNYESTLKSGNFKFKKQVR